MKIKLFPPPIGKYFVTPIIKLWIKEIKGIELKNILYPSMRYNQINEWYVKTDKKWFYVAQASGKTCHRSKKRNG